MKSKILNLLLILTSLAGYMEWGGGNRMFLFQAEAEVFQKIFTDFSSVMHPLVVLPIIGQILLVFTLFQKSPDKALTLIGMVGVGSLLVVMLGIGIIILNITMILSTLPFVLICGITIAYLLNYPKAGSVARSSN